MSLTPVVLPQLGVNDDSAVITEWKIAAGDAVRIHQVIAVAETTKAAFDIEAETEGFIYPLVKAGDRVPIRDAVAIITSSPDAKAAAQFIETRARAQATAPSGPRLTNEARRLAEQYGIDLRRFAADRIIRAEDVLALLPATLTPPASIDPARRVAIYGASQGGLAVAECLVALGLETALFLDDGSDLAGTAFHGIPVASGAQLEQLPSRNISSVATHIANARTRIEIFNRAQRAGVQPLTIVHPRASVASSVRLGTGCLVKAGAIVDAWTEVGDACIIDNGVILPHHNRIGQGCHLAPGACFGGNCEVGAFTVIGIGAVVSARIRIGANVIVGPGAVVCRDVPDGAVIEGVPARILGERRNGS